MEQIDLEKLCDRRCATALLPVSLATEAAIFPAERPAIANAVPKRRREFSAGRACAHQAMIELGFGATAVAMGQEGAPVWPAGLVGSITHTDTMAAAVIARRQDGIVSIGLDLEPNEPLPEDLLETVLRAYERERLGIHSLIEARLIFSAKESVFKCQYGVSRCYIDFQAAEIELDFAHGSFRGTLVQSAGVLRAGQSFAGRFDISSEVIATCCQLDA